MSNEREDLEARIAAIEAYLATIDPLWNMKIVYIPPPPDPTPRTPNRDA